MMEQFYNPYEPVEKHGSDLPHWQQGQVSIFVTWRLCDSLPSQLLQNIRRERELWLAKNPQPWDARQADEYRELFSARIESWLDQGNGGCCLRESRLRVIVSDALMHFNGERYEMDHFVIMPNHTHFLFQPKPNQLLKDILHSWKSYSAKQIQAGMNRTGRVWAEGYWDRLIRNEAHLHACRRYILSNPAKANLKPDEYSLYPDG